MIVATHFAELRLQLTHGSVVQLLQSLHSAVAVARVRAELCRHPLQCISAIADGLKLVLGPVLHHGRESRWCFELPHQDTAASAINDKPHRPVLCGGLSSPRRVANSQDVMDEV